MKVLILGGGPAGLYAGLLIKKAFPTYTVTILERNPQDVTYGWGVVFSDRTLAAFQRADYKTYEQISSHFVIWDAIDVLYRNETMHCGGHVIASIERKMLLHILQRRCIELGITLHFNHELHDLHDLPEHDLLLAADGINSIVRKNYADAFKPSMTLGKARYIWLGARKVLDAFTFIFRENEHGLFQVHAYPSSGTTSTFIVECDESSWLKAGLNTASEEDSVRYCEQLFAEELHGAPLIVNNSRWLNFPTLKTQHWHYERTALLGDAAHSAHFSIGSGTKLAMEDAIALASALEKYSDLEAALNAYELERKPVVETFQQAATESQGYFETIKRYLNLEPLPFTFQLLTRSGRISYDDLRLRDPRFGDKIDRWYTHHRKGVMNHTLVDVQEATQGVIHHAPTNDDWQATHKDYNDRELVPIIAPPPMFTPLELRALTIPNRVVVVPQSVHFCTDGIPSNAEWTGIYRAARGGVGLVLAERVAIALDARITDTSCGLYTTQHKNIWRDVVAWVHERTSAKIGIELCHAGRRGATRGRNHGLDRPLADGWPLIAPSPIAYTLYSQTPKAMERDAMDSVRDEFVQAACVANEAGFDLLQLHYAHGYLLASFLSPLSNQRDDNYGGDLEQRMRFPLEVFDAVRAIWPAEKPLSVSLNVTDYMKGGLSIEDGIAIARILKTHGCDMIAVLAGQTISTGELPYKRGFLTPLSDRVRNEADIATMVGGYLTTSNEINTVIAAGRADLCIMESSDIVDTTLHLF